MERTPNQKRHHSISVQINLIKKFALRCQTVMATFPTLKKTRQHTVQTTVKLDMGL